MDTAEKDADREAATIPVPVKMFLVFSAAAAILSFTIFVPALEWLTRATAPFTSWAGSMPYIFALAGWPKLVQRGASRIDRRAALRWYLGTACLTLLLGAAFGIVDWYMFGNLEDEASPWLRYHPLRPLWTVVLPLVWAAILWTERRKIRNVPAQRPTRQLTKKSALFFTVSACALIAWCSEAFHYWIHNERTVWGRGLLIVLAVTGFASLLAGIFVRSLTEDTPA